jgi:hypothetical protein
MKVHNHSPNRTAKYQRSGVVCGVQSVQISPGTPVITNKVFPNIPRLLSVNAGIVPELGHDSFPIHDLSQHQILCRRRY